MQVTHGCRLLEIPQEVSQLNVRDGSGWGWVGGGRDEVAAPGSGEQVVLPVGGVVQGSRQVLCRGRHGPIRTLFPLAHLLDAGNASPRLGERPGLLNCIPLLLLLQLFEQQLALGTGGLSTIFAKSSHIPIRGRLGGADFGLVCTNKTT